MRNYSQTKICYISTAPNPKRWAQIKEVRAKNTLIQAFCAKDERLQFIDVHPVMLAPNGEPKPEIFVEDQLHMNAKGYKLWKGVVGPVLMD